MNSILKQRWELVALVVCLLSIILGNQKSMAQGSRTMISATIIQDKGELPEPITNGAVTSYFKNDKTYVYSFGGIDSTLKSSGIHLRCYRINANDPSDFIRLNDIPDTLGKIALSATRIGSKAYIVGGYHVFPNGKEASSKLVHEFDLIGDTFTSKKIELPLATDDHVQGQWNDSLLYVVNGWSDSTNVRYTQVYNPQSNTWLIGTALPNSMTPAFGATGNIIGNEIYIHGGARADRNFFPAMSNYYRGKIDPLNPHNIAWTKYSVEDSNTSYRSALYSLNPSGEYFVIGGSNRSYNYDGIDYQLKTLVAPLKNKLRLGYNSGDVRDFELVFGDSVEFPMDIRDWTNINYQNYIEYIVPGSTIDIFNIDASMFLIGGINEDGTVSNKIISISNAWLTSINSKEKKTRIDFFPNPITSDLNVYYEQYNPSEVRIFSIEGTELLKLTKNLSLISIDLSHLGAGIYLFVDSENQIIKKLIKK